MAAGAAVATAFALLIGAAAFRLRGAYFAIGTLALGEILRTTVGNALPEISTLPAASDRRLPPRAPLLPGAGARRALGARGGRARRARGSGSAWWRCARTRTPRRRPGCPRSRSSSRALALSTALAGAAGGLFALLPHQLLPVAPVRARLDVRRAAHDLHRRRRHAAGPGAGRGALRVPEGVPDRALGGLPPLDLRRALHRHRADLPRRAGAGPKVERARGRFARRPGATT